MSRLRTPQSAPRENRTATIITISVVVAILVLLGIALLGFAMANGFAFASTPTPTATSSPIGTPTPNARATHVAEDMQTQVAVATTLAGGEPPAVSSPATPTSPVQPTAQSTSNVQLPIVVGPDTPQTPAGAAPLAAGTSSVFMPSVENADLSTPTPILLPVPLLSPAPVIPTQVAPTPIAPATLVTTPISPTPVFPTSIPPSSTPLPLIPPTPTPFFPLSYELAATMRSNADTVGHVGPSNAYTATNSMPANSAIRLRGRTAAGDWVYACCLPSSTQSFWVRRAYVNISNNVLPTGAPEGSEPNDARWLGVAPPDLTLVVRATPTSIPLGDFPLARYDSQNTGHVTTLPGPPLQIGWNVFNQAAQGFVSPAAVSGPSVLASSQDNHLYSLDLYAGNQRWRKDLQSSGPWAPSIQDGLIYIVSGAGNLFALQDQNNLAGLLWQSKLPANATSPLNIWLDTLLIGVGEGSEAQMLAIRRSNPDERREFPDPNQRVQQPAIGQETVFVGADRLWALDVNLWVSQEIVWTSPDVFDIATAPVYAYPGVVKLAELYVADGSGIVHALDANTGVRFWTYNAGAAVTALAVNEVSVFVVGNGALRAVSRQTGLQQWAQPISGAVMGGPLVTRNRVLVVMQNGGIALFDAVNGGILDAASSVPSTVPGGPAVSGVWVLVPATSQNVFAYRGTP